MLLFKKPFLSHSPPAIENEKHAALKTNKPVNSGNKYVGRGSTRTGWRGHYGFGGLYSSGQVSMHCELLCVHTRYNLFAHSSCTSLVILIFIKSTVGCIAHFSSLHILLLILFYFIFYLFFYLIPTYIYIYSLVLCFIFYLIFLHCPLSGPVLTYISLLIIPCMIVYVTNKQEPWTLNWSVWPVQLLWCVLSYFFTLNGYLIYLQNKIKYCTCKNASNAKILIVLNKDIFSP